MKIRTNTRATHTLTTDAGVEVELTFEPVGDPLVHETRDTVIAAYMIHDSDCENPMTSGYGDGVLHMLREGRRPHYYRSDNPEVLSALGLDSDGTPDIDQSFDCAPAVGVDGIQYSKTTLRDLAADEFLAGFDANEDFKQRWVEHTEGEALVEGQDYTIDLMALGHNLMDSNGVFWEEIDKLAVNLYAEHWQTIAGPFVVPVASYNEGRVGVTTWDGDTDDLPNGVWVADKEVQDNLVAYPPDVDVGQIMGEDGKYTPEYGLTDKGVQVHRGTLGACWEWMKANYTITADDLDRAVIKYATGVLEQYSAWASGEIFGITVEIFERDGDDWVEAKGSRDNECWNFIGRGYAEETLRTEFFEPAVAALQAPA